MDKRFVVPLHVGDLGYCSNKPFQCKVLDMLPVSKENGKRKIFLAYNENQSVLCPVKWYIYKVVSLEVKVEETISCRILPTDPNELSSSLLAKKNTLCVCTNGYKNWMVA